jgi:hypothetical protein
MPASERLSSGFSDFLLNVASIHKKNTSELANCAVSGKIKSQLVRDDAVRQRSGPGIAGTQRN